MLPDHTPAEPSTDHAECTEGADVLDAGHREWGFDVVSGSIDRIGPLHTSALGILHAEARVGIGHGIDVSAGIEPWNHASVQQGAPATTVAESGLGATSLSARWSIRAGGDSLLSSCVGGFVRLPGAASGPGTRSVEGGVFLPVSLPLGESTRVNAMVEGEVVPDLLDSGRSAEAVTSAEISRDLGDRFTARVEALAVWYGESGRPWLRGVNAGVSVDPLPHFGVALGVAAGRRGGTSDFGGFGRLSVHP